MSIFALNVKKITTLLLSLCMLVSFSTNFAMANEHEETIDKIVERGVLRVGFSSFVPWAMQNKEGEYIGFEIDVAKKLAQDLGVELQLVPTNWDGIIPALLAGKFDVIIGGMGANVQRGLSVNFSVPYDYATMDAIINIETGKHIKTFADLNSKDVVIAARTGSSAVPLIKSQIPNAEIKYFNEEAPAIEEVLSGRADVFISSKPLPTIVLSKNPEKVRKSFEITSYREPIGFAVRKGELNTLNVFDTWIRQMHGVNWLKERSDYWFGTTLWQDQVAE